MSVLSCKTDADCNKLDADLCCANFKLETMGTLNPTE